MEQLRREAEKYNILLNEKQLESFRDYKRILLEWNKKINLTAITNEDDVQIKHFLDCLLLLYGWVFPAYALVLDVGSGAGFPGIPLKISRPDLSITLMDSINKRISFLEDVTSALEISCELIQGRAELLARESKYRERFDVVTARAVASLPMLSELCMAFVKIGGVFLAMKGPDAKSEAQEAREAIRRLGGEICDIKEYDLPHAGSRSIIIIKKISQTPTDYPRTYKKMSNSPL